MRTHVALRVSVLGSLSTVLLSMSIAPPLTLAPASLLACSTDAQCDDGNVCTADTCDLLTGCVYANTTNPCSDSSACTSLDTCSGGACVGTPLACDDGNLCTTDSCNPATGCVFANNTIVCDDADACTAGDACAFGACRPGTAVNCNDNNVCTNESCDPATGCVYTNNTAACSDSNACTVGDTCVNGSCATTPVVCDDGNLCTTDSCNPATGCVFANNAAACDDGNACTAGDVCAIGACQPGPALNCNDGNLCTTDSCDPATGCGHANNAIACSDGNACTVSDVCSGGSCQPGAPRVCGDNNACTTDACEPATGCVFTNNTNACVDGDACTVGDVCSGGSCQPGVPPVCDDGNLCTTDSCNTATGCVFANNANACDDGNACTAGDACAFGTCRPGSAESCNDNNVCTTESCDPATGCVYTNNTAACSDSNACTMGDTCVNGTCATTPVVCDDGNPCTTDSCDTATGCVFANNANACDDGNACTVGDACAFGTCRPGSAVSCSDDNPCTNDTCDPATGGCAHANNAAPCSDGNACTAGDTCANGACGGSPVVCDDNNVCTTDSCNGATGCAFTSNANACEDGNDCTVGDFCAIGTCRPGTSTAQVVMRVSDELVGAAGDALAVALQALPAGGNSIDLTLAYDPAVLQATGATLTAITLDAALTVDVANPGSVRVTINRAAPFTGFGPVAMVQFQVVGGIGTSSALNFTTISVNSLTVTACGDGGHVAVCGDLPAEIQGVTVSGNAVSTIAWTPEPGDVTYEVTENYISRLRSDRSTVNAACMSHGSSAASAVDTHPTPVGDGFYYLVRAVSACGKGPFGNGSYGESRTPVNPLACP